MLNMYNFPDLIMREKVEILDYIIDKTNANIVFSTSWREKFHWHELVAILEKVGFKHRDKCVGVTPIAFNNERSTEIRQYIAENSIDYYVILDDNGEELLGLGNENQKLLTNPDKGITMIDAEKVAQMFERQMIQE